MGVGLSIDQGIYVLLTNVYLLLKWELQLFMDGREMEIKFPTIVISSRTRAKGLVYYHLPELKFGYF